MLATKMSCRHKKKACDCGICPRCPLPVGTKCSNERNHPNTPRPSGGQTRSRRAKRACLLEPIERERRASSLRAVSYGERVQDARLEEVLSVVEAENNQVISLREKVVNEVVRALQDCSVFDHGKRLSSLSCATVSRGGKFRAAIKKCFRAVSNALITSFGKDDSAREELRQLQTEALGGGKRSEFSDVVESCCDLAIRTPDRKVRRALLEALAHGLSASGLQHVMEQARDRALTDDKLMDALDRRSLESRVCGRPQTLAVWQHQLLHGRANEHIYFTSQFWCFY